MKATQAVVIEPLRVEIRTVELPAPSAEQILVRTIASAVSPGTELAIYDGTHQWLADPRLPDWKFPFRAGYSAAGEVIAVGSAVASWRPGDRVSYPGNHASAELLTPGHERGRLWRLPDKLDFETAAWACIARYGLGAAIRPGITLGRSAAVLGLGVIGQWSLRCLRAAGASPLVGIDTIAMRRQAALYGGADRALDPAAGDVRSRSERELGLPGLEIVADATGIPDCIPQGMAIACNGGQVVVVGSPRGRARDVNFYDDLHRRFVELSGAHGNMLFDPGHQRMPGDWTIDKAQNWILSALADGRLSTAGLVTHTIAPDGLGAAYEGLQREKDEYLGVVIDWT